MTDHPGAYNSWRSMMGRCLNPRDSAYPTYGARGIAVCERWHDFWNFLADMGERPAGTTIDRYPDGSGNYEPGNCRWATAREQNRNKRNAVLIDGHHLVDVAQQAGVPVSTASRRHGRGHPIVAPDGGYQVRKISKAQTDQIRALCGKMKSAEVARTFGISRQRVDAIFRVGRQRSEA